MARAVFGAKAQAASEARFPPAADGADRPGGLSERGGSIPRREVHLRSIIVLSGRVPAAEQHPPEDSKRPHICSRHGGHRTPIRRVDMLWRHKGKRPRRASNLGEALGFSPADGDPKIDKLDSIRATRIVKERLRNQNVPWLHIAMHGALRMHILENRVQVVEQRLTMKRSELRVEEECLKTPTSHFVHHEPKNILLEIFEERVTSDKGWMRKLGERARFEAHALRVSRGDVGKFHQLDNPIPVGTKGIGHAPYGSLSARTDRGDQRVSVKTTAGKDWHGTGLYLDWSRVKSKSVRPRRQRAGQPASGLPFGVCKSRRGRALHGFRRPARRRAIRGMFAARHERADGEGASGPRLNM